MPRRKKRTQRICAKVITIINHAFLVASITENFDIIGEITLWYYFFSIICTCVGPRVSQGRHNKAMSYIQKSWQFFQTAPPAIHPITAKEKRKYMPLKKKREFLHQMTFCQQIEKWVKGHRVY